MVYKICNLASHTFIIIIIIIHYYFSFFNPGLPIRTNGPTHTFMLKEQKNQSQVKQNLF